MNHRIVQASDSYTVYTRDAHAAVFAEVVGAGGANEVRAIAVGVVQDGIATGAGVDSSEGKNCNDLYGREHDFGGLWRTIWILLRVS
jgi:hypothetical protein